MSKKYELTNESIELNNNWTLFRIRALKDFGDVKAGDLGGFVESESNLSHDGNCWVYNDAKVCEDAIVSENAKIYDTTIVRTDSLVSGNVTIGGNSLVKRSHVYDFATIDGNVVVSNSKVHGFSLIMGKVCVYDRVVCGNDEICVGGYRL